MAKFQRAIIFLAMLSASHLSHASVIAAGAAATAAATAATTAAVNASIASEHARRAATNASANTTTVSVTQSKPNIGFVTCGKRNSEMVGSLGCVMWQEDDRPEIPWNSWPGYILGKKIPTSYEVNAISFDQYNGVATVYFLY
ncbi:hypothetical protein SNB26_08665 [Escherichia coli]|nr:hypothetical protein [Escherichia coli]MDZ9515429.1 hypothetical protein [Escherichia coli]MEA0472331.1 hypothetical protein [Escherichia coli]